MNTKEEKLGDGRKQENATRICKKKKKLERKNILKNLKELFEEGNIPCLSPFLFVCLGFYQSLSLSSPSPSPNDGLN